MSVAVTPFAMRRRVDRRRNPKRGISGGLGIACLVLAAFRAAIPVSALDTDSPDDPHPPEAENRSQGRSSRKIDECFASHPTDRRAAIYCFFDFNNKSENECSSEKVAKS